MSDLKPVGVSRKIDELRRIVLPSEARAKLGLGNGDKVSVYYGSDNTLILQLTEKYPGKKCVFCDTTETEKSLNGKDICAGCLEKIVAAYLHKKTKTLTPCGWAFSFLRQPLYNTK